MYRLLILLLVGLFACSGSTKDVSTLWINSYNVNCSGVGMQHCMQIQESDTLSIDQWQLFYDEIDGFEYEAGFIYKLKVAKKHLNKEDVPADASTIEYSLVEIVSKEKDSTPLLNDLWLLVIAEGQEIDNTGLENIPMLEILLSENTVIGRDGCNRLSGTIKKVSSSRLEFMPLAGTRMMCPNMTLPDKFGILLDRTRKYKLNSGILTLIDESDNDVLSFKKVD